MGYFDGLTDGLFKKSETGETLCYPWGAIGKGYKLKSQAEHDRIRSFVKNYYVVGLPTILLVQLTVGVIGSLVLLPILVVWYQWRMMRMLKGTSTTTEKLSVADAYATSAKSHNLFTLVVLELCSVGFVAAGIWSFYRGSRLPSVLACIGFFGLCSVSIGFMIFKKIK